MKTPTTGTTKNPTMATSPPTTSERLGTPRVLSCLLGIVYLTTWPPASKAVAATTTPQPVSVPTSMPHTRIAAQTSSAPGTTGTTTPTSPTAMPSATSTSTPVIAGSFAWEVARLFYRYGARSGPSRRLSGSAGSGTGRPSTDSCA